MSTDISKDFPSFPPFTGLVDIHFNESVSFFTEVGRWTAHFMKIADFRFILVYFGLEMGVNRSLVESK